MELTIKNPNRSHWIELDFGDGIRKEELYPILTATIRGEERTIEVSADRYRVSSGHVTQWRIYPRDVKPADGIGEATMRELRKAVEPLVSAWLASSEYRDSRRRAIYAAIAREVADSRYGDGRARRALATAGQELRSSERKRLERALRLQAEIGELLQTPAAV